MLFWTRDHPTQYSVGGFKTDGYNACRHEHMEEQVYHHRVVYLNNKHQTRHPPKLQSNSSILKEIQNMQTIPV